MTVTAIFHPQYGSHRKHPLPFTHLAPVRTETGQKDFPFNQNKWMPSLNKESEMAWWCPVSGQTKPWASCPRWPCIEQHGKLENFWRSFQHQILYPSLMYFVWSLSPELGKQVSLLHDNFKHARKISSYKKYPVIGVYKTDVGGQQIEHEILNW